MTYICNSKLYEEYQYEYIEKGKIQITAKFVAIMATFVSIYKY